MATFHLWIKIQQDAPFVAKSNMSDGLKHLTTTHTTITHFLKVFFEGAKGYPSTGSTATSYYSYQTFIQLHLCRMCHVIRP